MRHGRIGTGALAIACLWVAFGAEMAAADKGAVITHLDPDPQAALDYWTPERMRAATEVAPPSSPGQAKGSTDRAASKAAKAPDFEVPAGFETLYPYRVQGRIFMVKNGGNSSCSATVVTSATLNLVTTAAHCLFDPDTGSVAGNLVFVPGYRDNARPYGTWVASSLGYPAGWLSGFRSADFGVLNLLPNPSGVHIEALLGSRGISFNRPINDLVGQTVDIFGYPSFPQPFYNGERLIECDATIKGHLSGYALLAQPCNQQHGSSGGGWIQNGFQIGVVNGGSCGPGCDRLNGLYLGTEEFQLWSSAAGGVPKNVRQRMKACKKNKKRTRRQRCLNRAQTFRPTGA